MPHASIFINLKCISYRKTYRFDFLYKFFFEVTNFCFINIDSIFAARLFLYLILLSVLSLKRAEQFVVRRKSLCKFLDRSQRSNNITYLMLLLNLRTMKGAVKTAPFIVFIGISRSCQFNLTLNWQFSVGFISTYL